MLVHTFYLKLFNEISKFQIQNAHCFIILMNDLSLYTLFIVPYDNR